MAWSTSMVVNAFFDACKFDPCFKEFRAECKLSGFRVMGFGRFLDGFYMFKLYVPAGFDFCDVLDRLAPYGCEEVWLTTRTVMTPETSKRIEESFSTRFQAVSVANSAT